MWKNITMEDCEVCPYRYNVEICLGEHCPPQQEKYHQRVRFIASILGRLLYPVSFLLMYYFR